MANESILEGIRKQIRGANQEPKVQNSNSLIAQDIKNIPARGIIITDGCEQSRPKFTILSFHDSD
jgi:hypothetical protein